MHDVLMALARHAETDPDRPAINGGRGWMSYRDLYRAVGQTAAWAASLPETVALLAPRDERGIVWSLALAWAGRTIVPLPEFFSPAQWAHLIADSGAEAVVTAPEMVAAVGALNLPVSSPQIDPSLLPPPLRCGRHIIYTSGTTGRPKGVVLGERQIAASVKAMAEAVGATAEDRMLSVLPFSLLLEQVAGMAVPLFVGASIAICPDPRTFPPLVEGLAPTATVLVPEMLAGWVHWLEQTGQRAPASLRFVAVGGAPVPPRLAERAWALGLPVYEGYGLSECCSVVAVNRPGQRVAGTVGRPLAGIDVQIDQGEIVVSGPTVMEGYLGHEPSLGVRRTGDAGHFDAAGHLVIDGRIDDVIVTSKGRNIHPEWIESMILADPRVGRCAVVQGGSHPLALLCPASPHLASLSSEELTELVAKLCAEAPDYARPSAAFLMTEGQLGEKGLITANGRLRRRLIASHLKELGAWEG